MNIPTWEGTYSVPSLCPDDHFKNGLCSSVKLLDVLNIRIDVNMQAYNMEKCISVQHKCSWS